MGDVCGRSSVGSIRNAVGNDLYRETSGNHGTMGGVTTYILKLCRGEELWGGWTQEGGLVAPIGDRETTSGHLVRNFAGS